MAGLDVLISTKTRFRTTGQSQVLMELATIRLCRLADMLPLVDVARRLDGLAKGAGRGSPMPSSARVVSPPAKPINAPSTSRLTVEAPPQPLQSYPLEEPEQLWAALLEQLGNNSQVRFQLQRSIKRSYQPPSALLVTFPAGEDGARDYCSDANRCSKLEDMLKKLAGKAVALRFELAVDANAPAVVPRATQLKQQAMQVPLAKAVMEQLAGQIVHIDAGFGVE